MKTGSVAAALVIGLCLSVLAVACGRGVAPEDVYRHEPEYSGTSGARNIAVEETTEDGVRIAGSELSVVVFPPSLQRSGLRSFVTWRIETDPEEASFKYTIDDMIFDSGAGYFYAQAIVSLGENSSVPANLPLPDAEYHALPPELGFFPDAPGSQNVSVGINERVGHTEIAGLRFEQEATINVWETGVVEADREGIEATDPSGATWVSKNATVEGKDAIVMIRK